MATILSIDTSATPVSCAILRDDCILASFYSRTGLTHSQTLMSMVENALRVADLTVRDVDVIAVSAGPGSFTGVRIGVSAVKGLAFSDNKPCVAVSTLEAMARNLAELPFEGIVCCVMDARCQQVYTASFVQRSDGTQERLTPDEALSLDDLSMRLEKEGKAVLLVGDGSPLCYNAFKETIPSLYLAPLPIRYQSAVGVAMVAATKLCDGEVVSAEQLLPLYLRLPQAERELKSRLSGSGK